MLSVLRRLKRICKDESGDALVIGAVGMVAIVAFAGLAIDVGQLRYQKRVLQADVDAAALAAELEVSNCGSTRVCTNMQNAAKEALVENGYSSSSITLQTQQCPPSGTITSLTLVVNQGPCILGATASDPNYGNTSDVEAEILYPQPMMFASVLGISSKMIVVRAEAGSTGSSYCVYTDATSSGAGSAGNALLMNGGKLDASCGIMVDSTASPAAMFDSGSTTVGTSIGVIGPVSSSVTNNGGSVTPSPTVASAVKDPLSSLTAPTAGSCTQTNMTIGGTTTLTAGTYCGGINMNGSGYTVTLDPGTYVFTGAVNIPAVTVTGTGVTLYFTSGTLQMNSSAIVQVTAPTSGTYKGIVLWQSSSNSAGMDIDSGSTSYFQGAIYLPDAALTLNSNCNSTAAYTILDVQTLTVNSGVTFNIGDNYSSLSGGSPIPGGGAVLVE